MDPATNEDLRYWLNHRVLESDDPLGEWVEMTDKFQLEIVRLLTNQRADLRAALKWLVNLHDNIGQDGEKPYENEWADALNDASTILNETEIE